MAGKKKESATAPQKWEDVPEIPKEEQPYPLPDGWKWVKLIGGFAECLDSYRKPVNASEREKRQGNIPYYGATGQVGWIDDYLTNENLVLVGEDGAPFLDHIKNKAYIIDGKAWVNNHAHILRSFYGKDGNLFLMHYLNQFNYKNYVNGTTRLKLTQSSLQNFLIPVPPSSIITKVVAHIESLFSKLDEAAEKVQAVIDGHEARKQAILHKAFSGELTKKWREENGVSFDSWEEKNLIDICMIKSGTTIDKSEELESGKIPYIKVADMNLPDNNLEIKTSSRFVNKINNSNLFPKNCIIFPKRGGAIFTNKKRLVREREILADLNIMAIIPNENKIALMFLYYWFLTIDLSTLNNGTNVPQINNKDFIPIKIKLPSINEQDIIVKLIKNFLKNDNWINNNIREVNNIIFSIKKSILTLSFAGKL